MIPKLQLNLEQSQLLLRAVTGKTFDAKDDMEYWGDDRNEEEYSKAKYQYRKWVSLQEVMARHVMQLEDLTESSI